MNLNTTTCSGLGKGRLQRLWGQRDMRWFGLPAQPAGGGPSALVPWLPGSVRGPPLSLQANMSLVVCNLPLSLTLGSNSQLPVKL